MKKKIESMPMIFGLLLGMTLSGLIFFSGLGSLSHLSFISDETSKMVDAFGRVLAIFVGLFSVYLLYETLTSQQEGNREQRSKADSDIIFILLNQLEKEYDSFELHQTKGPEKIVLKGYDAISTACHNFKSNASVEGIYEMVKNSIDGMKILYLVRSFMLIREKLQESDLNEKTQTIFRKKLEYYYRAKFKYPILFLTRAFPDVHDPFIEEIRYFQNIYDVID